MIDSINQSIKIWMWFIILNYIQSINQEMNSIHYDLDFPIQAWIGLFLWALKLGLDSYKVLIFGVPFSCTFFWEKNKNPYAL